MSGGMAPREILARLDFNAVHSGDPIARAYFGHAAETIRALQREVSHVRRQLDHERGHRVEAIQDAEILAGILERIVADVDSSPVEDRTV